MLRLKTHKKNNAFSERFIYFRIFYQFITKVSTISYKNVNKTVSFIQLSSFPINIDDTVNSQSPYVMYKFLLLI